MKGKSREVDHSNVLVGFEYHTEKSLDLIFWAMWSQQGLLTINFNDLDNISLGPYSD